MAFAQQLGDRTVLREARSDPDHEVEPDRRSKGWLMGYNGGPIRHPTSRVYDRDIAALRRGLQLAGLTPTDDPDEAFFTGRFPE